MAKQKVINSNDKAKVPEFWEKSNIKTAINKLDTSKMSPRDLAILEMSIAKDNYVKYHRKEKAKQERAEMRAEVKAEVKAEIQAEVKAEVKAEIQAEVKAEVKAEIQAEMKAEITKQLVVSLLKNGLLSTSQIAIATNTSEDFVLEIKNNTLI